MNLEEKQLWKKIKEFAMDDPVSEFSFTERLARENAWSLEFASRAVLEYKRFMFLICITKHPLTPSDQVDQVWHLHLLYTESYWIDFCQSTLERDIQHGPTKGGSQEVAKFSDWYEETKKVYATKFGQSPPPDLWPPGSVRFSEINFTRVNRHRNWVLAKPKLLSKWRF